VTKSYPKARGALAVGARFSGAWNVTATCGTGSCTATVPRSAGSTLSFTYSGGEWSQSLPLPDNVCVDANTGKTLPHSVSHWSDVLVVRTSGTPTNGLPTAFVGTETITISGDCHGVVLVKLTATRITGSPTGGTPASPGPTSTTS
jgi:hypothetical protein